MNNPDMRTTGPSSAVVALLLVLVHALVWTPVFFQMSVYAPTSESLVRHFNMELPAATKWAVEASRLVVQYIYLLPVVLVFLVVADWAVLWQLHRTERTRAMAWAWFGLIILLGVGIELKMGYALWLALEKLREGLMQ
jgi:type II secretory pathway component PulF